MSHAVEIAIDLPASKAQAERFCRDPQQFFVRNLKRKTVEISEKKMSPNERVAFGQAKQAEVKKFLVAKAMEKLPEHLKPNREQALRMRWILTYKLSDSGEQKPKARAVILGYQDPEYSSRPTFAPGSCCYSTRRGRTWLVSRAT